LVRSLFVFAIKSFIAIFLFVHEAAPPFVQFERVGFHILRMLG